MAVQDRFGRNIKPASISVDEDQESFHTEEGSDNEVDDQDDPQDDSMDEDGSQITSSNESDEPVAQKLSAVSFGALKKANETLSRKRKADDQNGPDKEVKLESLRERLQLIKEQQSGMLKKKTRVPRSVAISKTQDVLQEQHDSEDDTDDSGPEEATTKGRAKHTPAQQSSKYQVSRKRQVIDVPKQTTRDPRFDAITNDTARPEQRENAYGFLRDYQKSEMAELKSAIKKTKSTDDKETLRRRLNAMENRIKARDAKEREQNVVREHRKQERGQVREGKTPYYLKRSEIKQQALVAKFDGMKSKERERLLDRRRKKESQKEKRRMPEMRRGVAT